MLIQEITDKEFNYTQDEHVSHLRRMLAALLERQSDASLSTFDRNKVKKTIKALRAGIDALQVQAHA